MKVAVIGGGGFRAPLVWESLRGHDIDALVLHDIDGRHLARISGVIDGLRDEHAGGPAVVTTTDLVEAVEGADVVFCAIRVGGLDGRVVDETVPVDLGILGQETVGPGGICFALRTVPVMIDIAGTVARYAPDAWFLNFTNPAGLVTEAVRGTLGDRAVGICDAPAGLSARVARALGRKMADLRFDYVGLNHLGWLLAVYDGGDDLLPGLLDDDALDSISEVQLLGADYVRAVGAIPNEYLVYYERPDEVVHAFRAAHETRAQLLAREVTLFYESDDDPLASWRRARDARFSTYMSEAWESRASSDAADGAEDEGPGEAGYAAIAAAFTDAAATDSGTNVILDVANGGRLKFLDDDAVIEKPCSVARGGVVGVTDGLPLPPREAELVARIKEVERLTIRAAVTGSRSDALEALAAHPVVPSRGAASKVLDRYLAAFPSLAHSLR